MQRKLIFSIVGIILLTIIGIFAFTKVRIGTPPVRTTSTPSPQAAQENGRKIVRAFTMDLKISANSSPSGKASIIENSDKVSIIVTLGKSSSASLSAALHRGTCSDLGDISYDLNPVLEGKSNTIIETAFDNILSQAPVAVVVRKNGSKENGYDFCADLK